MTPEERAQRLVMPCTGGYAKDRDMIAAAIREAVAEERRTNAQIARDYDQRWNAATCDAIAAAILSRDVFTEQT